MRTCIAGDNSFAMGAMPFVVAGQYAHHAAILRLRYEIAA
jgi:hypothetical protein